jgi:hypothetical protein
MSGDQDPGIPGERAPRELPPEGPPEPSPGEDPDAAPEDPDQEGQRVVTPRENDARAAG